MEKTAVVLALRDGRLELRFTGKFTSSDLTAVKTLRGRRWDVERRAWQLPYAPEILHMLESWFQFEFSATDAQPPDVVSTGRVLPIPVVAARRQATQSGAKPVEPASIIESRAVHEPASAIENAQVIDSDEYTPDTRRILDGLRRKIRTREYSPKTERSYLSWVRRFLLFHAGTVAHRDHLVAAHAAAFLEHLALSERLAARSRNQAAAALSFMFREVLGRDEMADIARAKGSHDEPLVLSHWE
ncbi:MAG: site-specific integrase, partial [Gemmatimonadota bacterium]